MKRKFFRGGADNAVGLDTADGFAGACVGEDRFAGFRGEEILSQRGDNLIVELDDFGLVCFLFGNRDAFADAFLLEIINVVPGEAQKVADSQRGM